LIGGVLSSLGLPSLTDLIERLGLILFGAALVLLGIHLLASGGSKKQPFNINVSEESGPGGTTRKQTVRSPVGTHSRTTKTAAGGAAKKGIATDAVEAAAVA
jgi:hypothetical protein